MSRAGAAAVDDAFGVISHPLRRALIESLVGGGEARVTELAARLIHRASVPVR